MKVKKRIERVPAWAVTMVACAWTAAMMLSCAGAYAVTDFWRQGDNRDRLLTAYLSGILKSGDEADAWSVTEGPYGQVLRITDAGSGYEIRLYRYDGKLVEDYGRSGSELAPETAQPIAATKIFEAYIAADGACRVYTDAGMVLAVPRSSYGGGAHEE